MDVANYDGTGHGEQVVATRESLRMFCKTVSAEILFAELVALNHGAHGAVEHEDSFRREGGKRREERGERFLLWIANFFFHLFYNSLDTGGDMNGSLEIIDNLHGLLHLLLVVEIHFEVDAVATNVVEQRAEFVEGYPTGHDALAAFEDLPVEVVPFG